MNEELEKKCRECNQYEFTLTAFKQTAETHQSHRELLSRITKAIEGLAENAAALNAKLREHEQIGHISSRFN